MNKKSREVFYIILSILFAFLYVHYPAPIINNYTESPLISWGLALIIYGIWGNIVKLRLLKSIIPFTVSYKAENYVFITLGSVLIILGISYMVYG
jgi:hypothetical protein